MFVQIAKDGDTDDDHDYAESHKSVAWGEKRPVVGGVALEERDFGEYEEYCSFPSAAGLEVKVNLEKGRTHCSHNL